METWTDKVVELYRNDPNMEVDEFEQLYAIALTGQRPDHPGLPAYLPLPLESEEELRERTRSHFVNILLK